MPPVERTISKRLFYFVVSALALLIVASILARHFGVL